MRVSRKSLWLNAARLAIVSLFLVAIQVVLPGGTAKATPGEPTAGYRIGSVGTQGAFDLAKDGYLEMSTGFIGGSAFTVEGWVYSSNYSQGENAVVMLGAAGTTNLPANERALTIRSISSNAWSVDLSGFARINFTMSTGSMTNNTWNYVAVSGDANGINFWLNGSALTASGCNSSCNTVSGNQKFKDSITGTSKAIGGWVANGWYSKGGIVSSLRLSNEAVYSTTSSTMTVPNGPLTALATTKLLLNNPITNNSFIDSSNFRQTLTKFGVVEFTQLSVAPNSVPIEYLVVGGGGAGGLCGGGGGGAGGVKVGTTTISSASNSSYTIKVGGGGTSVRGADAGGCGNTGEIKMGLGSTIETAASVTLASALGGGDGGYGDKGHANRGTGTYEASGCGTMLADALFANGGGSGRNGCDLAGGAAPGGFAGSRASLDGESAGAGGGAGGSPIRDRAINKLNGICDAVPGGVGVSASLTGSAVTYGTGGTGGSWCVTGSDIPDSADFTGNGGAGSAPYRDGGDGGSGIVVIRYASASKLFSGGLETTSGDFQIHTFKKSVDNYTQETFSLSALLPTDTVTFNKQNNSASITAGVIRGASATAPSAPTWYGYNFKGWSETTNGVVRDVSTVTINSAKTFYGIWEQKSLAGLTNLPSPAIIPPDASFDRGTDSSRGSTSTRVKVPAGALPSTFQVKVYTLPDNDLATQTLGANNTYIISQVVAWSDTAAGSVGNVQDTAAGKPIEMTITSPDIKIGAKVYSLLGNVSTLLATATQDGSVTATFSVDPVIVVQAAPIVAPPGGGSSGSYVATPSPTPTASKPPVITSARSFNVLGFNPGSWQLTKSIKKSIDSFFKSINKPSKISCVGYTMGPTVLRADYNLAMRRGQEVCNYVVAKNPTIAKMTTKGTTTKNSDGKYRRTTINWND